MAGGRIELITGPMFAGKSKELWMRHGFYANKVGLIASPVFVPGLFVSGGPELKMVRVQMHDGGTYIGKRAEDLQVEFDYLRERWPGKLLVVCIDEVQFFPLEVVPVIEKAAREWGWTVICAGLDYDFKRYEFTVTWELRKIADVRIECFARCAICGERADVTQRLHLDGTPARWEEPQIVLNDGSVRYEPRCWRCHKVAG